MKTNQSHTPQKRTTIYDLAKLAKASPSTVSSILNGTWRKRRISTKLADKITLLAKEHGYSVNFQASLLRRVKSNIIGMIMPKYNNRYFGAAAELYETMARKKGLFPIITCTFRDPELELAAAKELISYQVDCLILMGATAPEHIVKICKTSGVNVICLDLPAANCPSVISDDYEGAKKLTKIILQYHADNNTHNYPLTFIGGRAHDHNTKERIRGFCDAHVEYGINIRENSIITCGYAPEKAQKELAQFDISKPTGFFVNSTITLEGFIIWMNNLPTHKRDYIRYGCFDWDPFAALHPENLGMVQQDIMTMLTKIFDLVENPQDIDDPILVPCKIKRL